MTNKPFPSDLEIALAAELKPITEIAAENGISEDRLEPYGKYVAKVLLDESTNAETAQKRGSKYIVVTAVTPTPLGEGKTATSVSLAQGFAQTGRKAALALRQPAMGPTFGIKGGAAGGGYSQIVPMEKLNLHLTGDFHAVTAAHNLLAAMIDNHLHQGNDLRLDPRAIEWRRVIDMNDRSLRNIVVGLGERIDGVPRQTGFDITSASEIMVILSLATSFEDLRKRLAKIVIGLNYDGEAVTAADLKADGAMAVILADAINPNLLQTLEHTPALIHAGPFGNIATGNSSVVADYVGLEYSDYVITEAGFGADMGAERFFNVKCRISGLKPDAAVLVVTVRSLKSHSGLYKIVPGKPLPEGMLEENPADVEAGATNLKKHIEIVRTSVCSRWWLLTRSPPISILSMKLFAVLLKRLERAWLSIMVLLRAARARLIWQMWLLRLATTFRTWSTPMILRILSKLSLRRLPLRFTGQTVSRLLPQRQSSLSVLPIWGIRIYLW